MTAAKVANSPDLVVFDRERRVYLGLNRAGDAYHMIQPAQIWDPRVGDGKVLVGELVCTCQGGTFHGTCYQIQIAIELEIAAADAAALPRWAEVAAETELERAAARG